MSKLNSQACLHIDCERCRGLCCQALYFSSIDGFPKDKVAGEPCIHLETNYRCQVHNQLTNKGLKGCINFDCLGAGQWLTSLFQNSSNKVKEEMFDIFPDTLQLFQTLWYLLEAESLTTDKALKQNINQCILQVQEINSMEAFMQFDIIAYQTKANQFIKQVVYQLVPPNHNHHQYLGHQFSGRPLNAYDFSMKNAIAADFKGCSLNNTVFLGTDLRDADFRGCDLRKARFLTQAQVNSMKGDQHTMLPEQLHYPSTWQKEA